MRRRFADMNPTLRGFLIIVGIVLVVILLNQQTALLSLVALTRIAFFLAVAFFVYLLWRERRGEISTWPTRSQVAFYGGGILIFVGQSVPIRRALDALDGAGVTADASP